MALGSALRVLISDLLFFLPVPLRVTHVGQLREVSACFLHFKVWESKGLFSFCMTSVLSVHPGSVSADSN